MFFKKYDNLNFILKVILLPILLFAALFWFIGNLAHLRTLVMWMIGLLMGFVGGFIVCYLYLDEIILFLQRFGINLGTLLG